VLVCFVLVDCGAVFVLGGGFALHDDVFVGGHVFDLPEPEVEDYQVGDAYDDQESQDKGEAGKG